MSAGFHQVYSKLRDKMDLQPEPEGKGQEIFKGHITEEMISEKFMKFMKEGKGKKHIYKISLLEARYNSWLKRFEKLSNKRKTYLLYKKKNDRKMIPTAIDAIHSHVRWIKFSSGGLMACVKSSAVIIASGYYFFIYNLHNKCWEIISCQKFQAVDGVGCLGGARHESLFAFSEKCKGSGIYLVTYPELEVAYMLKDRLGGKVMSINFGENETLIVLKCMMTEHHIVIWSWRTSKVIFSYPCENSYLHPGIFRVNNMNSSCAKLGYEENEQIIHFWNINFCGEETVFINRRASYIKIKTEIHDMFFDGDNTLYLLDSEGSLYYEPAHIFCSMSVAGEQFDYTNGKTVFLCPWKDTAISEQDEMSVDSFPVDMIKPCHLPSNITQLSKGKSGGAEQAVVSARKPWSLPPKEEGLSLTSPAYVVYDSDEYDEGDDPLRRDDEAAPERGLRCHMVQFQDGIVLSGPDGRVNYLKRSSPTSRHWTKEWGLIPASPFTQFVTAQESNLLMAWSDKYGLVKLDIGSSQNNIMCYFGGKVRDMCFLHPADSYFLTINDEPVIFIWKKKTGRLLKVAELPRPLEGIVAHPEWPLVVGRTSCDGTLYVLDLSDPRDPQLWAPLRLTRDPLRSVSFLHHGDLLAALSADRRTLILIKVRPETGMEVLTSCEFGERVLGLAGLDFASCERACVCLLEAVPADEPPLPPGRHGAGKLLEVRRYSRLAVDKRWPAGHFYCAVHGGPGAGQVLAVPADLKAEVHNFLVDLKKAGGWQFLGAVRVCHQVGTFELHLHEQHLVTYGMDGLVTCYDPVTMFEEDARPFCVLVPHHRYDGRIRQVIIDYKANYVITRGKDGLLIGLRIKLENRCEHSSHTLRKGKPLNRTGLESKHALKYSVDYWEDVNKKKRLELDKIISTGLINRMTDEIEEIKKIWQHCFTENQKEPPENRIPLDDFELYKAKRDHLIITNENEISERLATLESLVMLHLAWNRRWEELCSELMPQELQKLKPFIASYFIENFNQSLKPEKYLIHNRLLQIVSDLDSAIFPIPEPKMFPWLKLDDDEEYEEFKLQKFPIESILPRLSEAKTDEGTEEVKEETPIVGEDLDDVQIRKESQKRLLDLNAVIRHQEQVISEMKSDRKEEKEKIIFQELENIRQFYNEKYLYMKYRKEGSGKTFEEFKKEIINPKSSDSEEEKEGNVLEANIFQDDLAVIAGKPVKEEEEEKEEEAPTEWLEEEGEGELEGGEEELGEEKSGEGEVEGELEETVQETVGGVEEEEGSEDSSRFSWAEVEVGVAGPEEVVELSRRRTVVTRRREPKEASILEFHDLKKRSIVRVEGHVDPLEEPLCMNGAWSLRFVDTSYGRCNEFSLNGIFMSDSLVLSLQTIIDQLEMDFNKRFKAARERKTKDMSRIRNRNALLRKHIDDLVTVCRGIPPDQPIIDYNWSFDELIPSRIWTEEIKSEKEIKEKKEKYKMSMGEATEDEGEKIEEETISRTAAEEQERSTAYGLTSEKETESGNQTEVTTIGLDVSASGDVQEKEVSDDAGEGPPSTETNGQHSEIARDGGGDVGRSSFGNMTEETGRKSLQSELNKSESKGDRSLKKPRMIAKDGKLSQGTPAKKVSGAVDKEVRQSKKKKKSGQKSKLSEGQSDMMEAEVEAEITQEADIIEDSVEGGIKKEAEVTKDSAEEGIKQEAEVTKDSAEEGIKQEAEVTKDSAEEGIKQEAEVTKDSAEEGIKQEAEVTKDAAEESIKQEAEVTKDSAEEGIKQEAEVTKDAAEEGIKQEAEVTKDSAEEGIKQEAEVTKDSAEEGIKQEAEITDDSVGLDIKQEAEIIKDSVEGDIKQEAEIIEDSVGGDIKHEAEIIEDSVGGDIKQEAEIIEDSVGGDIKQEAEIIEDSVGGDIKQEAEIIEDSVGGDIKQEAEIIDDSVGNLDSIKEVDFDRETNEEGGDLPDTGMQEGDIPEEQGQEEEESHIQQRTSDVEGEAVTVTGSPAESSEEDEAESDEERPKPLPPTQEDLDRAMLQEYLEQMMGGAFQLTWQERLLEQIPVPPFLHEKEPDEFTPEDAEELEKYLKERARREKLIQFHKKQAEDEIKKIMVDVKEIIYKHDMDLMDTLRRRINTEGCIQSELLKVARVKQKKLIAHNTLQNISHMKDLLCDFHEQGMKLSKMSKYYFKKTAMLHNEFEKHQTALKTIDADFLNKLEPMKLTKKCTEILKSCMKKKPQFDPDKRVHPLELLSMARALKHKKSLPYLSEVSRAFLESLAEMDAQRHCPPAVDAEVWAVLVECRHAKVLSDLKCRALMLLIAEAEKTSSLYYKYFVTHLQRYDKIKCHIRDQKIRLEHHCKKMEILLPEGLIESHHTGNIDDFKDCVYISRKFIDNLNKEIVELQKQKEEKWKDFDNYMEVVNSAELHHKELRLKLRIYDNLLRDIKTAQINKYTKEFLAECQRKKKPSYEVKLYDTKKQEKIKTMVRKYFDAYYRAIKNIKTAKNTRGKWIKENMELSERNDRLIAENQEMFLTLEKLNKLNKDDQLQEERNRAIQMHSKLSKRYENNVKRIDELETELHRLYMKNYPTFEGFSS